MVDPTGITAGMSALNAVLELTGHESKKELKEKLEQAQRYIVDMRMKQLLLMEKVANLERQHSQAFRIGN